MISEEVNPIKSEIVSERIILEKVNNYEYYNYDVSCCTNKLRKFMCKTARWNLKPTSKERRITVCKVKAFLQLYVRR